MKKHLDLLGTFLSAGLLLGLISGCHLPQAPAAGPILAADTAPAQPPAVPAPATPSLSPTSAPPNVQDLIERCPTEEEIAAIDADLRLTFSGDPYTGTLECRADQGSADLTLLQLRAYQVLLAMRALAFDQPLPWTDLPLYAWFHSIIDGIHFDSAQPYSSCCNPPGTINLVTTLYAVETDRWLQADDPDENVQSLLVLLIHEARHAEGYFHTCGTRDQRLDEMGAFGVQYWTYVWLAYHSDPTFLSPGGPELDLYRRLNRDKAVDFLVTSDRSGSPFCAQTTLTPGPTPTVP